MKKLAVLCCMLLTLGATSALAGMSGTLVCNNAVGGDGNLLPGMVGINAISSHLTWSVEQLESGLWDYTYTLTPLSANKNSGAGSIVVEFGSTPTVLDWDYTFVGIKEPLMDTAITDGVVKTIDRTPGAPLPTIGIEGGDYPSNLGAAWTYHSFLSGYIVTDVATTFQGMEWLLGDGTAFYHYGPQYLTMHLVTDLAPTWGNVYFDGFNETSNNGYGMLRNTNYDLDPTTPFVYDESLVYAASEFLGWVATPGGASAVPVPASVLLFGSGLAGLVLFRRRTQA